MKIDGDDPELAPFFAGCRAGELRIPHCTRCGAWNWYPRLDCRTCAGELRWTPVSGRARLFTWTVVHRAFLDDFKDRVPYLTALVELEEDPLLRLAALLVDVHPEELHLDLPLEACFEQTSEDLLVPRFRPRR
jgi:uncharacterized protein